MRSLLIALMALGLSLTALAQVENIDGYADNQGMREYFANSDSDYNKSVIYVFFNNQPCYECAAAIEMIEQNYNQNFRNLYNMFLINYQNDDENNFISTYQLSRPLEVVLVRVDDGATFGYKKLENLQNMTTDPVSFAEYFNNDVTDFLGNE